MSKRTATKPAAKGPAAKTKPAAKTRSKRSCAISKLHTQLEAELLSVPDEWIREEMAFWSWPDTPEGELWFEMSDTLEALLKDVGLDARERKFLWPDAGQLDLEQSVRRINQQYPNFSEQAIKEFLIDWFQELYVPEGYSESQMDELERLTERWAADLEKGEN
jgi:hypothetical protein